MKKLAIFTTLIVTALCCVFAFTACENDDTTGLVTDKHYIKSSDVRKDADEQVFYVFHSDGTGEYTYHYDYESSLYPEHNHYVISFKYTYVDSDKSAVVCFYDGIERLDGDDGSYTFTSWTELVTVSKNVLTTVGNYGYIFWINEDYLNTIPNYYLPRTSS